MASHFSGWLQKAAGWLKPEDTSTGLTRALALNATPLSVSAVPGDVLRAAIILAREAALQPHTGSFKRGLVLKQLMHAFPAARRRDLSLAIELAVRAIEPDEDVVT